MTKLQLKPQSQLGLKLTVEMQRGLALLEMPLVDLVAAIHGEIDDNPLLEIEESQDETSPWSLSDLITSGSTYGAASAEAKSWDCFLENALPIQQSLFDNLLEQAREVFTDKSELDIATFVIGSLDQKGLLTTPLEELRSLAHCSEQALQAVLERIWQFDPPGIAARSFQESLLLQLKRAGKEQSIAYSIIEHHFEKLLNNDIRSIGAAFERRSSEIEVIIKKEIAALSLRPAWGYSEGHYPTFDPVLCVDMLINFNDETPLIVINQEKLPRVRLNVELLNRLDQTQAKEARTFLKEKLQSGKWLLHHLFEREHTLYRIAEKIAAKQRAYLLSTQGILAPWTMRELASDLNLNVSTITRAISGKYLACNRGILSLRSLFTSSLSTASGKEISNDYVKTLVSELIAQEDASHPLSDEKIATLLQNKGIVCARRTVTKYRLALKIDSAQKRKK